MTLSIHRISVAVAVALAHVAVLLAGFTPLPADPWWQQSRIVPSFQRGAEWLRTWLPESVAQEVNFVPVIELRLPAPTAPAAPPPTPPVGT